MSIILKHIKRTLIHKWHFYLAARKVRGISLWSILTHDLSKFSPTEAKGYAERFYGFGEHSIYWEPALLHHFNHNPHHWEYWVRTIQLDPMKEEKGNTPPSVLDIKTDSYRIMEMPNKYIREMVCDWLAATRTYTGSFPVSQSDWEWYRKNFDYIRLHPVTRFQVQSIIDQVLPLTITSIPFIRMEVDHCSACGGYHHNLIFYKLDKSMKIDQGWYDWWSECPSSSNRVYMSTAGRCSRKPKDTESPNVSSNPYFC